MPVLFPPSVVPLSQGYRLAAKFYYDGTGLSINSSINQQALTEVIDLHSIQTPANLQTIKAVQFSLVSLASDTPIPNTGAFYVVVDGMEIFAFNFVRNNPDTTDQTTLAAIVPVQSISKTKLEFAVVMPNFVVGSMFALLYVNCFDFDVRPFVGRSQLMMPGTDLVVNGGFEDGLSGWFTSSPPQNVAVVTTEKHSGLVSLQCHGGSAIIQVIPTLKAGKLYILSLWIKTDGQVVNNGSQGAGFCMGDVGGNFVLVDVTVGVFVNGAGNPGVMLQVNQATDWTQIEMKFQVNADCTMSYMGVTDCYGTTTNANAIVWFDDVSLIEI